VWQFSRTGEDRVRLEGITTPTQRKLSMEELARVRATGSPRKQLPEVDV